MVEFTGERLVPEQAEPDLFNEHFSRYAFAARLARHKRVLDIASGMGYGSAHLATVATNVIGTDISAEAVEAASERYSGPNLRFVCAPAQHLPFENGSFDLITAFEVIEHLEDWPALLSEARRLLAPGGQFIVSTPNKLYYAQSRSKAGPNPFHVHEFEFDEFRAALSNVFPSVALFLQNHTQAVAFHPIAPHPVIASELAAAASIPDPAQSHFFLAVCALTTQTGSPVYLYVPGTANVLREREEHIAKLEAELAQKDVWLEDVKSRHSALQQAHVEMKADLDTKTAWALQLNQELESDRANFTTLQNEYAEYQAMAAAAAVERDSRLREFAESVVPHLAKVEHELAGKIAELGKCVDLLHQAEATVEERTVWARQLQDRIAQLEQVLQTAQGSRWVRFGRTLGVGPDLRQL